MQAIGASDAAVAVAPLFAGRYRLGEQLKRGDGVDSCRAVDVATGADVVVKTYDVGVVPEATLLRFQHETRVLQHLSTLGLCALTDAGQADDHLYLAQRYAPGRTLEQRLRDGRLDPADALRVGIDVALALDIAHGAGVVHRDVKPANIVVEDGPDGRLDSVTLIDFGFAASPWLHDAVRNDLVGTVRYLAPESAGLISSPADERADLYALGVVLFECLAAAPPFTGPTVSDLLRQHLSTPAPELRAAAPGTPRALAAAVARLLRKDPAERYQSAAALGADLAQLREALRSGQADPALVIGRSDRREQLTDPAFVGRAAEQARLAAFTSGLAGGGAGLVLLEADSGGGKSRLLDEVSEQARAAGVTVLTGQGVALAGQRPFTVLHGIADGLARVLAADAERAAALARAVADVAPAVFRALPALQPALGVPPTGRDAGPEQFGELRSIGGLRRLFGCVASAAQPVLLVLDDCQWADMLTVRLLGELFDASGGEVPRHLGVIAAFRSEEVPARHPLRLIAGAERLHLGPLGPDAVTLLAESMAGPLPGAAVDTVVRLADGNPFMAAAVLRGLVESAAVVPETDGWTVDEARLPDAQAARRSAAFLVRRLELLTPAALELLSVGAVLGKQFDVALAVRIAGTPPDAPAVLDEARRRRLLWTDDAAGTCTFFHDKIRESLLDRLDADVRRALHGRAADALLAVGPRSREDEIVFDLAYHLTEAGRTGDALPHALAAAALARSRYALDSAAAHYRMAASAVGRTDVPTRVAIAEGLGDVLMLQGSYADAETQFAAARALVSDPQHAADLEGKLGGLAFKQGEIATAKRHLEGALTRLGCRVPGRWTLLPSLLWELLVQAVHTLLPKVSTGRRNPSGADRKFLAMRLYSRLAYLYWFHSGKVACAWAHLREMNLAERYPPSAELGQAWSEHAPVMTMLPWYRRGERYAQRSYDVRRELGDVWGQGQSRNFTGIVLYAASAYDRAQAECEDAIRLLRRTGDQWEVNTASWTLAACLLRKGELGRAAEAARTTYESALAINDQTAAGISLSVWTRAVDGDVPSALIRELLDKGGDDAQTTAELQLADALVARASGDLAAAERAVECAVTTIHDAGLRQEYIAPVFAWQATVLRERAEQTPAHAPGLRRARVRAAARAARRARRWARGYRNNAPHALRESALVASLRGRRRTALRRLRESAAVAHAQGARYERALTELAVAELACAESGDTAARDAARAAVLDFWPAPKTDTVAEPETLSLFDRFTTLLASARAIAAASTPAVLEAAVRDGALGLLRAERCHLTSVAALHDGRLATQSGHELDGVSRSLLLRAVEEGTAVVALDDPAGASADSLVLSGIRSALAAPIFVQGEAIACLYVTHRQLGELFGDEEVQLAAFIATLAGAAYEHLAGSETRFHALAQSSSDVITLVGASGVVTFQSAAMSRVFGLPARGLLGQPVQAWVHPDDAEAFAAALADVAPDADVRVECRLHHGDGSYRFAETVVSDLRGEPTVAALVLNTRDVTDRRRAEEELREKNLELEKLGRAKDTFLANMSHELRTPLNAIIGFTGTLLMKLPGPLNADQERQLRTVERSGKHLLAIINDLLDMAKIESGEVRLSLEEVDCAELIESVTASLQPLADEKGLPLRVRTPGVPVIVRSDPRALGQILINLVSNAIKFTEQGGVDVSLADGPVIIVQDTGPGIDPADLTVIFDAFERGTDRARHSKEGTGLGLHISRRLAELVSAEVRVDSVVGQGSTFTVRLPGAA